MNAFDRFLCYYLRCITSENSCLLPFKVTELIQKIESTVIENIAVDPYWQKIFSESPTMQPYPSPLINKRYECADFVLGSLRAIFRCLLCFVLGTRIVAPAYYILLYIPCILVHQSCSDKFLQLTFAKSNKKVFSAAHNINSNIKLVFCRKKKE